MKKALAAGVLLALMLLAALLNVRHLDDLTGAMIEKAEISRACCRLGDLSGAEANLLSTADIWDGAEKYVGIFLRQSEEDGIEESLWALRECLRAGEKERSEIAYERLEERLRSMAAMEHVSWVSIF